MDYDNQSSRENVLLPEFNEAERRVKENQQ